jgi:hypothetical protein
LMPSRRFQAFGDERSRFVLLERGLGVGVDLVAPFRHLGMKFCDAINYRHWRASLLEATPAWRAKRLPVNRPSLSRVVARRVLFPPSRNRPGMAKYWGARIGVLFATTEIASGFAKRPSSKAHSNTRQRPSDRMPNPHCRLKRCRSSYSPRRIELGISGSSAPPGTQLFLARPPGVKGGFPPTGAANPRCA